jgi:biopolymer transport protein TolR
MAASLSGSGGRGRRRRGRGRGTLSEINVTPMVDVMLVLLIIFMVSAPLLTVGVPVELPKTDAAAMNEQSVPLTVTIRRDGQIFVQDRPAALDEVASRLAALSGDGPKKPVYVRADGGAVYAVVAQVMAKLSTSGFTSINLVTDTGASPPAPAPIRALN